MLGFTFKENCPDTRNTKVIDIINELKEYNIKTCVTDPISSAEEVKREYGIELVSLADINNVDAIVLAVNHSEYLNLTKADIKKLFKQNAQIVLLDVKGTLDKDEYKDSIYWRL